MVKFESTFASSFRFPKIAKRALLQIATRSNIGVLSVSIDPTKLEPPLKTEEGVSLPIDKSRSLFETLGDAVLIADENGRYVDANSKAEILTGYSRGELLNLCIADISAEEIRKDVPLMYEEFKKSGLMSGEFQIVRKDQRTVDIEYTATVLGPGRYLSIMRDVTERKKLQEALQQSERQYRTLVETSNDLIWSINTHGRLTFVNQASRDILGYEPGELIGKHFTDLLPVEERSKRIDFINSVLHSNTRMLNNEGKALRKDGRIIPMRTNGVVLHDSSGQITGLTGISRDITEEKRAQDTILLQLQEKETLLQEVHHRSKNNLQIISSLLNLQMSNAPQSLRPAFREAQGRIQTMALLHKMLYIAKTVSEMDLESYLKDLVSNIQATFGEASEITTEIDCKNIRLTVRKQYVRD